MLNIYACGPTVYDKSHIGHARNYIMNDIIVSSLRKIHGDNKVKLCMNITDIDDKIINKALEQNVDPTTIAIKYETEFFDNMNALNVNQPDEIIRVSECIIAIQNYIQKIYDNGFAYISNGSVYFDTIEFQKKIKKIDIIEEYLETNTDKKHPSDFVLWKGRSIEEYGYTIGINHQRLYGRPGWHIECSTMIDIVFGSQLDYHLGGIDLKFPHHTNEELQAQAYYYPDFNTKPWCKFLHIGHLHIDGQKMSKSLKNFITIEEALNELTPNELRIMFIKTDWRKPMHFNTDNYPQVKSIEKTIFEFLKYTLNIKANYKQQYKVILDKINMSIIDMNFHTTLHLILELIGLMNKLRQYDTYTIEQIKSVCQLLGLVYNFNQVVTVNELMDKVIESRTQLRLFAKTLPGDLKRQLFSILDDDRDNKLKSIGIEMKDTDNSSVWFY